MKLCILLFTLNVLLVQNVKDFNRILSNVKNFYACYIFRELYIVEGTEECDDGNLLNSRNFCPIFRVLS